MALIAFGINHNTSSLEQREHLAFSAAEIVAAQNQAIEQGMVRELAILSTCNRTEVYCESDAGRDELLRWLAGLKNVEYSQVEPACYLYRDLDAMRHLMKVASGLDSMVLGEPQILGQVKECYQVALQNESLGSSLQTAFQQVFAVSKKVRSDTAIGAYPVSVAYAAVSLARQIFSDLASDAALLIGAGETIELVAQHLHELGTRRMIVANRSLDNARELAIKYGAEAIMLHQIPERLHEADIVISSTASPLPVLGKGAVEEALRKRRHKPMFIVDIAVPRDVEAQVAELSDVFLYTVDDLREVIDENRRAREKAAAQAEVIIEDALKLYESNSRSLHSVATIRAFREHVDAIADEELERAKKLLASGKAADEVLETMARRLANKFMHAPTEGMKQAAVDSDFDLLKSIKKLFPITRNKNSDN